VSGSDIATTAKKLVVRLEEFELRMAAAVGAERYIQALVRKLNDPIGKSSWATHIDGACGELAYAKAMGLYWNGSVNTFKTPDVGVDIQIRYTRHLDGRLIVYDTDSDANRFVLVIQSGVAFKIAGHMIGAEAKKKEWWKTDCLLPAYFVPQEALKPCA